METSTDTLADTPTAELKAMWFEALDGFRSAMGVSADGRRLFALGMEIIETEMATRGEMVNDAGDGWVAA